MGDKSIDHRSHGLRHILNEKIGLKYWSTRWPQGIEPGSPCLSTGHYKYLFWGIVSEETTSLVPLIWHWIWDEPLLGNVLMAHYQASRIRKENKCSQQDTNMEFSWEAADPQKENDLFQQSSKSKTTSNVNKSFIRMEDSMPCSFGRSFASVWKNLKTSKDTLQMF